MHIPQPKAGYMAAIFTCPVNTKETALQPGERPYMVRSRRSICSTTAPRRLLSVWSSCARSRSTCDRRASHQDKPSRRRYVSRSGAGKNVAQL